MRFVNREAEMARLDALVSRGRSGLAALWGRRRVGKTRLLIEWCRRHGGAYAVADRSAEAVQRRYLAKAFAEAFPGFSDAEYPDWQSFLSAIARRAGEGSGKIPLVFDEFPYLAESCTALPSIFQNWIDREAGKSGILAVIAGSDRHMMEGLVLDAASPVFGRAVEAFAVGPMSARDMAKALRMADAAGAVRAYSAWGGIPRYWELAESFGTDLESAVDHLVLDPLGPLHNEPERLLESESPPAIPLRPLLDVIGSGGSKLSEIGGRLGIQATSLSRGLVRLERMGLVARDIPFGEPERGGKRSLYRIYDSFFRMWFRVAAPNRAFLASASEKSRRRLWNGNAHALFSMTWEDLCRVAVPGFGAAQVKRLGRGEWRPASRYWHGQGPEWDVVALSEDGKSVLIGEAKWSDRPVTEREIDELARGIAYKGAPPLPVLGKARPVFAVFVPRCASRLKRRSGPAVVLDAEDVLGM